MSSFLHDLVARTIGVANVVRPRLVPRFLAATEPSPDAHDDVRTHDTRDRSNSPPGGSADVSPPTPVLTHAKAQSNEKGTEGRRAARSIDGADDRASPHRRSSKRALGIANADETLASNADSAASFKALSGEAVGPPQRLRERKRSDALFASRDELNAHEPNANADRGDAEPHSTHDAAHTGESHVAATRAPNARRLVDSERTDVDDRARIDRVGSPPIANELVGRNAGARTSLADRNDPSRPVPRSRRDSALGAAATPEKALERNETVVHVTIGRIEVRSPEAPPPRTPSREQRPAVSPREELDVYLRSRAGPRK